MAEVAEVDRGGRGAVVRPPSALHLIPFEPARQGVLPPEIEAPSYILRKPATNPACLNTP